MSKEMTLLEAMRIALQNIKEQSPEEYLQNVKAHAEAPIAQTIKELGISYSELLNHSRLPLCRTGEFEMQVLTYNTAKAAAGVSSASTLRYSHEWIRKQTAKAWNTVRFEASHEVSSVAA